MSVGQLGAPRIKKILVAAKHGHQPQRRLRPTYSTLHAGPRLPPPHPTALSQHRAPGRQPQPHAVTMAGSGAGVAETAEFIRQAIAHRPTDATAYSIVKHNLQDAVDAVVDEGNSVVSVPTAHALPPLPTSLLPPSVLQPSSSLTVAAAGRGFLPNSAISNLLHMLLPALSSGGRIATRSLTSHAACFAGNRLRVGCMTPPRARPCRPTRNRDHAHRRGPQNLCRLLESFCLCISSLDRKCEDLVHITLQLDWFRCSNFDFSFGPFLTRSSAPCPQHVGRATSLLYVHIYGVAC